MNLPRRELGRTGLRVTTLGFGGAPLGNLYHPLSSEEALETVRSAYAGGIRLFDTAPLYGHGLSERRMGLALSEEPRDDYVLCTKVGRLLTPQPAGKAADGGLYVEVPPFAARYDYSRDAVWRSVEASAQRMGVNRFDLLWIHDVDRWTHGDQQESMYCQVLEGALRALVELREQGIVSGYGLGVNEAQVCERLLDDADPDCFLLAGRYTLLEQAPIHGLLPRCEERGVSIVLGGPFNTGILATGAVEGARYNYAPATTEIRQHVEKLQRVCDAHGVPLAAAALQFPLGHPAVSSVIPGARNAAEVTHNLAWHAVEIPAALWRDLRGQGLIDPLAPLPGEGARDDC